MMGGYTYSLQTDVLKQRKLPIEEFNIKPSLKNSCFSISSLPPSTASTHDVCIKPFLVSNIEVESFESDIPAYNKLINNVQDKLRQLKIVQEKAILDSIEKQKKQAENELNRAKCNEKSLETISFKTPAEILANCDLETKNKILLLRKQVYTCINVIAGTVSQIKKTSEAITKILSEAKMASDNVYWFVLYTIIDSIFNCCDAGGQIFIKPSSVWPFSHLLSLVLQEPVAIRIYHSLVTKKNLNHVFKTNSDTLDKSVKFNGKSLDALVRLHMSLFVLTKDYNAMWSWFASTVNEYTMLPNAHVYMPIILLSSLEIAGHFALNAFKGQFAKIVVLINDDLIIKIKKYRVPDDSMKEIYKMYKERLEHLIGEFMRKKRFELPQGFDMKHKEEKLHANI